MFPGGETGHLGQGAEVSDDKNWEVFTGYANTDYTAGCGHSFSGGVGTENQTGVSWL